MRCLEKTKSFVSNVNGNFCLTVINNILFLVNNMLKIIWISEVISSSVAKTKLSFWEGSEDTVLYYCLLPERQRGESHLIVLSRKYLMYLRGIPFSYSLRNY